MTTYMISLYTTRIGDTVSGKVGKTTTISLPPPVSPVAAENEQAAVLILGSVAGVSNRLCGNSSDSIYWIDSKIASYAKVTEVD